MPPDAEQVSDVEDIFTPPAETDTTSEAGGGEGAPEPSAEDVAYAKSQGWVEKEKFRGPETEWIDAKTFSHRARAVNPIINARNRDLAAKNKDLEAQLEQVRRDAGAAIESVRAQAKREYTTQLNKLKAERAAAIDDGDGALVTRIEDDMAALANPEEPVKREEPTAFAPVLVDAAKKFSERNPWYGENGQGDPEKTSLAMAVARTLLRERPDLKGSPDFFQELEFQLQADHPSVFRPKAAPSMVDSGGRKAAPATKGKKTIADLPKDAQDTAKRYVRNGWLANEQEYVDQFLAEQAKEA